MRLLRAAALLAVLVIVPAAPAAAEPVPEGYSYEHAWLDAHDGQRLHAGVFLPADRREGERHPVILVITPYTAPNGGATAAQPNASGPVIRFPELFSDAKILRDRWAYVQVDARGFGGSGGCFEYYGPNEVRDAGTAVEWAAAQPWSTGRVGMWGKSYDAAQEVLALAARPRGLAAAVIQAPGLSAYTGLWMNRVHYATGRYATTGAYTADDLLPPHNADTLTEAEYTTAWAAGLASPTTCRTDALVGMNTVRDRDDPFWADREPYRGAAGSEVPVLWTHGFFDANTKPVHLDVWGALRGPKQAWFGQFTHLRGHEEGVGRRGFLGEGMRFLDRWVRGAEPVTADPPVTVQQGDGAGRWRVEEQWPPADARAWALPLRPGAYADAPGNTGDGPGAGQGHWTLTEPLPHAAHLAGEPVVRARLNAGVPDVNVVAHLYDVDPEGMARLVTRGAMAPREAGAQEATFALYPQDWRFEPGHRVALHLSGADDDWYSPGLSHTDVEVAGGAAELPLLRFTRDAFLEGGVSDAMEDAAPFAVPAGALEEGVVAAPPPPAMTPRPAAASPGPVARAPRQARRPSRTLRLRLTGPRASRRLAVTGRWARARRLLVTVRLGHARLARRTVTVRRNAYRATIRLPRVRSGRITVTVRPVGASPRRALRASVRVRARR